MTNRADALRHQNEQVVTFTLVELLTQLVFVAMLLALVLREQDRKHLAVDRVPKLERELAERDRKIEILESKVATLEEQLRRKDELIRALAGSKGVTIASGLHSLTQEEWDQFANMKAMLAAQQGEIAKAKAALTASGAGGVDKPNCLITSGFIVSVALLGNGSFSVSPAWDKGADVNQVPGLNAMVAAGTLSKNAFRSYGSLMKQWALAQPVPCGFKAVVYRKHGDAALFDSQLRTVEQSFYVARR